MIVSKCHHFLPYDITLFFFMAKKTPHLFYLFHWWWIPRRYWNLDLMNSSSINIDLEVALWFMNLILHSRMVHWLLGFWATFTLTCFVLWPIDLLCDHETRMDSGQLTNGQTTKHISCQSQSQPTDHSWGVGLH